MEEATPTISIIVPVYRVEAYLDRCVQSILNQTFSDFELILVDDGSPDRCGQMCDAYAQGDQRVRVLHKKNGGLSDARNAGIDAARGEYLGFVDSDDEIAPDMYESLLQNLVQGKADMAVCGLYDCYGDVKVPQDIQQGHFLYTAAEAVEYLLSGRSVGLFAVNKLYKRALFDEVRYPVGRLYEDAFVIVDLLVQTDRVVVDTAPKYLYQRRQDSITIGAFQPKVYDVVAAHEHNLRLIREHFPALEAVGQFRLWWAKKQVLERISQVDPAHWGDYRREVGEIAGQVRKNLLSILKNPYNSRNQKIAYLMIAVDPRLFLRQIAKKRRQTAQG